MDIKDAADKLGIGEKTLRTRIKEGLIQARKVHSRSGPKYEITEEELERFKSRKDAGIVLPTVARVEKDGNQVGKPGPISTSLVKVDPGNLPSYQPLPITLPPLRHKEPLRFIDELPDILTVEEVAQYLGVGVSTVREYLKEGKLRGLKLGRGWKISKDHLEAFRKKLFGR